MGLVRMPAANAATPMGSAPPAMRDSTRGAGLPRSTVGEAATGTGGTTVLTVGAFLRVVAVAGKARNPGPCPAAARRLDLGPPIGGRPTSGCVLRPVDPRRPAAPLRWAGPIRPPFPGALRARLPAHPRRPVGWG